MLQASTRASFLLPQHSLRILHVVPRSNRGGIYRVVCDLLSTFEDDPDVIVEVALMPERSYSGNFSFGNIEVPVHTFSGSLLGQFQRLRDLARRFDLVHLHGFTPWQAFACRAIGRPIVYTNHGLIGKGRKLKWYEPAKIFLMKCFLNHGVACVVNVSHYMQERLVNHFGVNAARVEVVHNCTRWSAARPQVRFRKPLQIGYHGRFAAFKRIDRVLRVAALIAQEWPVEATLVGEGLERSRLQKLATEFGVTARFVDYQLDVRSQVAEFDVEIISSVGEPFGLVVLEGIQAGHPTFVFADGAGCTEIFDLCGEWFICDDENDAANKILSLRDPTERCEALRRLRQMQARVAEVFSPAAFHTGYKNIYCSVVDKKIESPRQQVSAAAMTAQQKPA